MWSFVQPEPLLERFHAWFPRSDAERRFKKKTAIATEALITNAALMFELSPGNYSNAVSDFRSPVNVLIAFKASFTEQGPCELYITRLDSKLNPTRFLKKLSKTHKFGNAWFGPPWREDPRLFVLGTQLGVAYTVTSAYERNRHAYQVWQRQSYMLLDNKFDKNFSDIFISIGNNSEFVDTIYPRFEKNWLFFEANRCLYIIYKIQPFILFQIFDNVHAELITHSVWQPDFTWIHSELRGSAPPVRVGGLWYVFAHTASYAVFVAVLSETFRPIALTREPVLNASSNLFVCGAGFVQSSEQWLLSAGKNDRKVVMLLIPHSAIVSKLSPVSTTGR